jgi:thioredoxin 1
MIVDINEAELRDSIENSEKPILIDFYAEWCGPCRASEPLVEEFSSKNSDFLNFYKVNVDNNIEIAREYGVRNIPCFILIEGKEVKNKLIGSPTKEKLQSLISEYTKN